MSRRKQPSYPEDSTQIYGEDFVDSVNNYTPQSPGYGDSQGYDQDYSTWQEPYADVYDDGYEDYDYYEDIRRPQKPTMAARAAGKASLDPYAYRRQSQPVRSQPSPRIAFRSSSLHGSRRRPPPASSLPPVPE